MGWRAARGNPVPDEESEKRGDWNQTQVPLKWQTQRPTLLHLLRPWHCATATNLRGARLIRDVTQLQLEPSPRVWVQHTWNKRCFLSSQVAWCSLPSLLHQDGSSWAFFPVIKRQDLSHICDTASHFPPMFNEGTLWKHTAGEGDGAPPVLFLLKILPQSWKNTQRRFVLLIRIQVPYLHFVWN